MDNDTRLKSIIMEKSKNGFAIISTYNSNTDVKNRKNTKRARFFEDRIIEAGFQYKKYSIQHNNKETEFNFIVFDKFDDGFNDTGIRLKEFIENCRNSDYYKTFEVSYSLDEYLKDKKFYHPLIKSEKEDYKMRGEIFLSDLFEPPETINGWSIRKVFSENQVLYHNGDILCSISQQPDGRWIRHYGTIKPIGASIKKEYVATREEAFKNLSLPFKKKTAQND